MPRDDDQSLGDEATLEGGNPTPADERSLGDRSTFGGSDGSSLSDLGEFADLPDHDMEIVDLSSRYKIEKSLGKGGMGEVLLATDTRLDRKVAIKRIRGDAGSSKAAVARFLTEAKSIAALSHNNVVQVYDYGRDQEGPFLIMEYVAGGSLLARCKEGPIELEEAVELARQLCDGLGRAHDAGIIHRDIKPANILLTHDNIPKLTDFGLAKAESRDHTMTMAGAVLGTLDFMPPEQRRDAALTDHRSDLWSLAATLYQMVTGASPKVIRLKKVPGQLRDTLDKALEESKDERFQSATELKSALQQSLQGVDEPEAELEQGKCPSCGTKNEASRKFCRSCAGSLEVDCLSCAVGMPVWEDVCGGCGTRQSERLTERREQMTSQKLEAEACLASHDYNRATELAIEIGNEADPRLHQLRTWSDEFREEVESTKRVQLESAKQATAEALSHEQAYDYSSGIKAFAQIPESILAGQDLPDLETARDVLARLQEKQNSVETLHEEINSRIKARNLTGLLLQVETLLELIPERADLIKLQQQLQKRESDLEEARVKTLAAAKALMQQHDYAGVLSVIAKLNPEKIDDELAELHSLAKTREAQCQELSRQIRQAVNTGQDEALLALIEEYLTLKPHDAEALKTRDELIAREQQRQAEAAALLARQREEAKKKQAAANELAAKQRARKLQIIIGSSIAAAFVLMLTVMLYLRAQGVARDTTEAFSRGDYAAVLELDPGNRQAWMMQQNAEDLATALRSRDYRRALQLDPNNAEALSMKKVADLKQALSDGDYVAALQLDPSNAEALSMKKKAADVQQALSDGDYVAALQLDPSNAEALEMKKKAADVQQALSDGDYVAALQLDPSNAEALAMKKKAGIQQALSDGDYVAALQLDPSNAEALEMKKKADIQQALSGGDYIAALELDPSNTEALSMKKVADILKAPPLTNSIGMKLKSLLPGTFMMGDANGDSDETPHEVILTQPFQIGLHEVTQSQYERVMGNNPSKFKGANNPVEQVSWEDAVEFCRKLSEMPAEKAAGHVYRLPTEAEWEYACRAGTTTKYSFGDDDSELGDYAWFIRNSGKTSHHPVGGKQPNAWGLYDMHGNVWEWCQDWYGDYPGQAVTNPSGPTSGSVRLFRGGCWNGNSEFCRSARRSRLVPSNLRNYDFGFRVSLSPSGQ